MMYSEFLSMTGKEESYISYKEYTESIEPIYMDCNLDTKQEFIKFFNETFEKMVYPVVEKILDDLPLTDTYVICSICNNYCHIFHRLILSWK